MIFAVVAAAQAPLDSAVDSAAAYAGPAAPIGRTATCILHSVTDGDTIRCADGVRVRLLGMDTPERGQGRFSREATAALRRLLTAGDSVTLELDVRMRDQYGRTLAWVWREARLINWVMVAEGWAVVLTYPPNVQHTDALVAAQVDARTQRRGLWAVDAFACLPRDFRRGVCRSE